MIGEPGESAVFVDREGKERKAVITEETLGGNATLVYTDNEDGEFHKESLRLAINIPNEADVNDLSGAYYKHKPDETWADKLI